ncbi:diguanylate cyclase domain-containing protein [Peribacillus sp. SCS-155]|uniref:diguanylate cyclase domain-containing protein n=1 Tax=Peribacillus sedimenti TaxID=3115297 RepID=UPI003905C124
MFQNILEQPGAFQYLFDNHPDGISIVGGDGHFLYVNSSTLTMFGYTREELSQISYEQLIQRSAAESGNANENLKDGTKLAIQHKEGNLVHVRLTCIPLVQDGQQMGSFLRFEDITEHVAQSNEISDIQEMFSLISEKSQNIISSISGDGIFTYISPTVQALLGYTPEEVIGKPAAFFNPTDTNEKFQEHRNSLLIDQNTVRFTGRVRHKNGEYRWYETTAEYIRNSSGDIIQTICVGRDITDRIESEEKIAYLAYHDSVTDLPNRRFFTKRFNQLIEDSNRGYHGLMLLDLDGFKYVNDTFGHDMGDLLLTEVAKRLSYAMGEKGIVARWGGDEFTVLQMNIKSRAELASANKRIEDVISEPFILAGHTPIFVTTSVGVSFFPEDGDSIEALIKKADTAMYHAKNQAKLRYE